MSKRLSLREFQRDLATRLGNAQRGNNPRALLAVESGRDGDTRWLLDLADAGEITPLGNLTPVALTKPWFAGVANVRGVLYGVADFSAFRGGTSTPRNAESRLMLIGARHGSNAALLIHRALGLRAPESMQGEAEPPPAGAPAWHGGYVTGADGQRWSRLKVAELLADKDFLDIVR